eukprot:975180-Pleurochrysis_carterae.AAC.1
MGRFLITYDPPRAYTSPQILRRLRLSGDPGLLTGPPKLTRRSKFCGVCGFAAACAGETTTDTTRVRTGDTRNTPNSSAPRAGTRPKPRKTIFCSTPPPSTPPHP